MPHAIVKLYRNRSMPPKACLAEAIAPQVVAIAKCEENGNDPFAEN